MVCTGPKNHHHSCAAFSVGHLPSVWWIYVFHRGLSLSCPPISQTVKYTPFDLPTCPLTFSQLNPTVGTVFTYCSNLVRYSTAKYKMTFMNNCTKSNKQPNILSLLFQILLQFHIKSLPIYFMLAISTIILISVYRYMGIGHVSYNKHAFMVYHSLLYLCSSPPLSSPLQIYRSHSYRCKGRLLISLVYHKYPLWARLGALCILHTQQRDKRNTSMKTAGGQTNNQRQEFAHRFPESQYDGDEFIGIALLCLWLLASTCMYTYFHVLIKQVHS